ncbi:hypothetical protein [Phaffia rhodozyma]|uniref:Uncharacterized protein n=1 Tax=Phaffia rhodozyma TaxID=264483 RepID=A0A0F7SF78_PHARH|nr:hypothetical protein [Phaffia rhodozyma]
MAASADTASQNLVLWFFWADARLHVDIVHSMAFVASSFYPGSFLDGEVECVVERLTLASLHASLLLTAQRPRIAATSVL